MNNPRTITIQSPAKINLLFNIIGGLPNGFHEVETLMQAINLEDELSLTLAEGNNCSLTVESNGTCAANDFPLDDSNLIAKAARLYLSTIKEQLAIQVRVKKTIPIAAGLAGGSSNAAAALLALNHYYGNRLSLTELETLAARLGSDVPFCIRGGTQVGRHGGDQLSNIGSTMKLHLSVIKPQEIRIATPWIYQQYDKVAESKRVRSGISLENTIDALQSGDLTRCIKAFANVFEPIVYEHYPELSTLRQYILQLDALGCFMTGSGPTLFAVCRDKKSSESIKRELLLAQSTGRATWNIDKRLTLDIWCCGSINRGGLIIEQAPQAVAPSTA